MTKENLFLIYWHWAMRRCRYPLQKAWWFLL